MKKKFFIALLTLMIAAVGAYAQETVTYIIDKQNGKFTSTNASGTWASVWTSNDGRVTLSSNANNMQWNGNNIDARSGTAKKATYTVAIPAGYEIEYYSFTAKALSNNQTLTVDGEAAKTITSSAATKISAEGVALNSLVFVLTGENTGTLISDFTITLKGDPEAKIAATKVEQGKVTTGIGNQNVAILRSTLTVGGQIGNLEFQGVTGRINATNLKDVKAIRAYFATNAQEFYMEEEELMKWREKNGTLFAEGTITEDGTYTITGKKNLTIGTHYLWIALDISPTAKEGNTVDATITSYTIDGKTKEEANGNPANAATIFLTESSVLMPMDMGSLYYRIPAICTSADGKRLVVLTDDRKNHNADLPTHCYVVAQYSEDKGRTWSNPVTVAGTAETGGDYGHGDASLITNRINGDIIGIMTSSPNGTGFFASTPEKPQAWKTIVSHDGGITWETPVDHTKELYATGSPHPNWLGGFTGSGAGLQKRDGTLVSPFVNRESPDGTNSNVTQNYYNFMSKDGGKTWFVSGKSGTTAADEPKVLERNNGDLAISVRTSGYNFYNVTSDDGNTWKNAPQTRFTSGISGNACDGEYMYWCSTLDGNPWNIVFQTLPNSGSRQNLSIALSTDEGATFGTPKTICPSGSAYSAATVLPDGTLGVYYEEDGVFGGYTMRFVRFSLEWASNGRYSFTEEKPFRPIQTHITSTTPTHGVQTLVLPFECEVPEGMQVYECTTDTIAFWDNGVQRIGTVLQERNSTTLQPFHPYIYRAEAGATFTFQRPIIEWQAQEMPDNCLWNNGPLVGRPISKQVVCDGRTVFTEPRNVPNKGGLLFNRLIKGAKISLPAYSANYEANFEDNIPSAICIITAEEYTDAIHTISAPNKNKNSIYDIAGRKHLVAPKQGIYIQNSRKVLK